MSQLDRSALADAVRQQDFKVLKWYVEHAVERGGALVGPEDAEARMMYYQLRQQQTSDAGRSGAKGVQQRQGVVPYQQPATFTAALNRERSGLSTSSYNATTGAPTAERLYHASLVPSLRQVLEQQQPPTPSHTPPVANTANDASPVSGAGGVSARAEHAVKVHHRLNRTLFRSYGNYVADDYGAGDHWTREWMSPTRALATEAATTHVVSSPTADTSTFLLARVHNVTASPKTITLTQKNTLLHEDEERTDIVQLERYEFSELRTLASRSYDRVLGHVHSHGRLQLWMKEEEGRLDISSEQVETWRTLSTYIVQWLSGPAKAQNALLLNEIILRHRLAHDEDSERTRLSTVYQKEAEHQLSELRRLRMLHREHQRATEMHHILLSALTFQGVDVKQQRPVAPEVAAVRAFGEGWDNPDGLVAPKPRRYASRVEVQQQQQQQQRNIGLSSQHQSPTNCRVQ